MTLRYAHLSPAHKRDAVRHLERTRTGTTTGTSVSEDDRAATLQREPTARVSGEKREWRRPGSNRGPRDYESVRSRFRRTAVGAGVGRKPMWHKALRKAFVAGGFWRFLPFSVLKY